MSKERVTVSIADVKMNLLTADPHTVSRLAESLNARVSRLCEYTKCSKDKALVMLIMEQADSQKKSSQLIRSQQEQIFALLGKNSALMGQAAESALYEPPENALLREIAVLERKNEELLDEMVELRKQLNELKQKQQSQQ